MAVMNTHSSKEDVRFKEIEHKFEVGDAFDLGRFRQDLEALGPTRTNSIRVRDRYYLTETGPEHRFLLRHRHDADLQQLTLKSLEADSEVRDEINLDLGHHAGDQAQTVEAFVGRMGVQWTGTIEKDLSVWYFDDCEVVHYRATAGAATVCCVEFEATRRDSLAGALAIVERFERATGFLGRTRSHLSLPQMLFPELQERLSRSGRSAER